MSDPNTPDEDLARRRQTLAAGVVVLLLFLGGWWLMSELQHHREVQDCLASGRRDCIPLDTGK